MHIIRVMLSDIKRILPKTTLPRYNATKRIWLKRKRISITSNGKFYEVSFLTKRNKTDFKITKYLPRKMNITDRFKCALVAYLCEGTKLNKGAFTNSSGQKGKNISFANTEPWLIKLVLDEFEKIGIKREAWRVRLQLFTQHKIEKEKIWWAKELEVPIERVKSVKISRGDIAKSYRAPHGIAEIGIESVIFGSVLSNLLNLLKRGKL